MPAWPGGLPCRPMRGLTVTPLANRVATENDVGDPIMRRRFPGTTIEVTGVLVLTRAEKVILFNFWLDTLKHGTLSFAMANWNDGVIRDHFFPPDYLPQFSEIASGYSCPITLRYSITS